jgi:hypothetical protein
LGVFFSLVVADTTACDVNDPKWPWEFNAWCSRHNKTYSDAKEVKKRCDQWIKNRCIIEDKNAASPSGGVQYGVNQLSDLTEEEFGVMLGGLPHVTDASNKRAVESTYTPGTYDKPVSGMSVSKNWCTLGYCSPIKNQEQCGSCWAYATTEAYESAIAIKFNLQNNVPVYSPQYLLDCNEASSTRPGPADDQATGCNGGYISFEYYMSQGNFLLSNYPLASDELQHSCAESATATPDFGLLNYVTPASNIPESQIAANLDAYGPIPVLVCADAWQNYAGGIMTAAACTSCAVDHVVVLVGYNATTWTIRNSWGTSWGVNGFIYMEKGTGACQISYYEYLVPSMLPATYNPGTPNPPPPPPPTAPSPTAVTKTANQCKYSSCMNFPVTVGAYTLQSCSNIPSYIGTTYPTGICISSISGSNFNYYQCPTMSGCPAVPVFGSSEQVVGGAQMSASIVAESTATLPTSHENNTGIIVGASVGILVLLALTIVGIIIIKRRANQEEIV